jgi:phosphohistidine swiveling domain-containing protein
MNRLGRRLADAGSLRSPDEIFFLRLAELQTLVEEPNQARSVAAAVAGRRREYQRTLRRCRQLGAIPSKPGSGAAAGELAKLEGDACSPGVAEGPAKLISGLNEFRRVRAGDIVICRQLRPAWTTLFSRIAGAAIEQGGILSHGAILAREYGIPVVINAPGLCELIQEGDWVAIDGFLGTISVRRAATTPGDSGPAPAGGNHV